MEKHPESVPVNALVPIEGTPMMDFGQGEAPNVFQMARTIATARVIMPRSMVRLSAGRMSFSPIEQAVMFLAGANSIFTGDKLLTTANPAFDEDQQMFDSLGLVGKRAFKNPLKPPPGHLPEPDVDPISPPVPPRTIVPPSTPRPQPAMHAAAK